jgi:hypothetical protein
MHREVEIQGKVNSRGRFRVEEIYAYSCDDVEAWSSSGLGRHFHLGLAQNPANLLLAWTINIIRPLELQT